MKKYLLIILVSFILASCSYQKRIDKWCKRCPSVESHDTIRFQSDTIIYHDSVFSVHLVPLPADTITIQADCDPLGEIDISKRTYDYDYVSVDVWVDHNTIYVKPYLNKDTLNVIIKNAKIAEYRYLYEKYKDYKSVTIIEKHVPGWTWWLLVILAVLNVLQYLYYKIKR